MDWIQPLQNTVQYQGFVKSNELLVHKQSRKFLELSNYHLLEEYSSPR